MKKFCDSRGIQTHNLLIRSQMLYSVELGSQMPFFYLRLQNYTFLDKLPNNSQKLFAKSAHEHSKCLALRKISSPTPSVDFPPQNPTTISGHPCHLHQRNL